MVEAFRENNALHPSIQYPERIGSSGRKMLFQTFLEGEISLLFTLLLIFGLGCWVIYGNEVVVDLNYPRLFPVIFWNALAFFLTLNLLLAKLIY